MASQCQICAKSESRNISIAFRQEILKENGGWSPERVNPAELETWLDIADKMDVENPARTSAYRKTKFEIFHSASTPGSPVEGRSDSSGDPTTSAVDTLCAFCRHLSLKRLCTQSHSLMIEITLGSLEGLYGRPDCSLCAFLLRSIAATFPANGLLDATWIVRKVYLRFASGIASIDSDQGVKVYLCISGESTEVLLRVYDGRNFDQVEPNRENVRYAATAPKIIPPFIDCRRARHWASNCFHMHLECRSVVDCTLPPGFRLIDVERRKVVRIGNDEVPSYVAFSYVWGTSPGNEYLATNETIDEFERDNSLSDLPATIEDCFEVCLQLGVPYLWVDRLCIVQDDDRHKAQQIDAMDTIYRAAEIVIVAASASNLQEGLAGISKRRRGQPELLLHSDGLKIVAALPRFADVIQHTTWQSRGWTYQEAVLGRRKLYLTSTQTFFDCGEGRLVQQEDYFSEGSTYGISLGRSRSNTLWQYYFHIDKYNRRTLSYQSDVYKAVQGILQTLYSGQDLFYGLPASDFDQALLWRGHSRPRSLSDEVTRVVIPA